MKKAGGTPITLDQLNAALDQLIAERGGEINPGVHDGDGYYSSPDGAPACIIGTLLPLLGLDHLRPGPEEDSNITADVKALLPGSTFEPEAILLASIVQEIADDGETWRRAVKIARGHKLWEIIQREPVPFRRPRTYVG